MLLVLKRAQMLVHHSNCIGDHPSGGLSVTVLELRELLLVVAQLIEQALAQIAAGDAWRIHLANYFESFAEVAPVEAGLVSGSVGGSCRFCCFLNGSSR